jgi:hypothetical protein
MAGADYRRCDECGGKTFYDAVLDYQIPTPERIAAGQPEYWLHGLGDWAVICPECAKTKICVVMDRADITTS